MPFTTLLINEPESWDDVSSTILAITQNIASKVQFASSIEEISNEPSVVTVVIQSLTGQKDRVLEIYWRGPCAPSDQEVAKVFAQRFGTDVIISGESVSPVEWLLVKPDGNQIQIDLDIEKLDNDQRVEFTPTRSDHDQ